MNLRKDDVLFESFDIKFMKRALLDLSVSQQLPTYRFLIERYYTKMNELPKTMSGKKDKVIQDLTNDFRFTWIFMNTPPKSYKTCKEIFTKFIDNFHKLRHTAVSKRKDTWIREVADLKSILDDGVDIRSFDKQICDSIITECSVEVGEEEELLYKDNCVRIGNCCPRLRWCGGVDTAWWKGAIIRRNKLEKQEVYRIRREARIAAEKAALEKLKVNVSLNTYENQNDQDDLTSDLTSDLTNQEYTPERMSKRHFWP